MIALTPTILDVSEQPAPEPMRLILIALAQLQQGQFLMVLHRKEPTLLYPKLTDAGFRFISTDRGSAVSPQFEIAIIAQRDFMLLQQYLSQQQYISQQQPIGQ